jgi:phosphatidylglycerol:prolipoprotein diacylglycerol transferase
MNIKVADPELYFAIFYILAFIVSFGLVMFFTHRLKIPFRSVLLMLTTVSLCTIVGSRLTSIPLSEWMHSFSNGRFEDYRGRFAVGGLVFGLAGLIFSVKVLGLGDQIYKLYAWITPLGLGIQKFGCFMNGC